MMVVAQIQISANNFRAPITLGAKIGIEVKRVHMSAKDITNARKMLPIGVSVPTETKHSTLHRAESYRGLLQRVVDRGSPWIVGTPEVGNSARNAAWSTDEWLVLPV